jgi:ABC-type multidrug transport system ATPase subunit
MNQTTVIKISNLTKQFKNVTAVENISLTVREGDVYGVLGPNGAGKTTTISAILGLLQPTQGNIEVLGEGVTPSNNTVLHNIGALVGDGTAYFPFLTGKQNVVYVAELFNVPLPKVDEVLAQMGIADAGNRYPDTYSTGMKQRLGLAMAIIHDPKVLVLDEPTNGMDPTGMREIRELIKSLAAKGKTIVLASHLLHEVEQVCNRVAVFSKGKIAAEGTIDELRGTGSIVHIRTHHIKESLKLLKSLPNVHADATEDTIEARGISSSEAMEHLVKHNLTPLEVYTKGDNLEDLFIKLVEQ